MTADNLNNMRVIPDLLAINEKVRPNKVAYRQFDDKSKTWISVTWKEFADMVRSWRKAFTASGLSKGDHAAVLLPNSITATACDLSILSQGMVPVPLHAVDTPSSSAFILNNSDSFCSAYSALERHAERAKRISVPQTRRHDRKRCRGCFRRLSCPCGQSFRLAQTGRKHRP